MGSAVLAPFEMEGGPLLAVPGTGRVYNEWPDLNLTVDLPEWGVERRKSSPHLMFAWAHALGPKLGTKGGTPCRDDVYAAFDDGRALFSNGPRLFDRTLNIQFRAR
jgi:hypothetical protein